MYKVNKTMVVFSFLRAQWGKVLQGLADNKYAIAILLFCSVGASAGEKANFSLQWSEEDKQSTDPIQRWQVEQKKSSQYAPENTLSIDKADKTWQSGMFGRVDKAHRQRYNDPNFSAFNSDESFSGYTKPR